MVRRSAKRKSPQKSQSVERQLGAVRAKFGADTDRPCDACGTPRAVHVPLCAERDPCLVTFWASLCEPCVARREQGNLAFRRIRARGWAHAGTVFGHDVECG